MSALPEKSPFKRIISIILLLSLLLMASGQAAAWTQFQNGTNNTGFYDEYGVPDGRQDGWSFSLGNDPKATPVVRGEEVYAGGTAGVVHSIWRENGTEKWQISNGGKLIGALAVTENKVFGGKYNNGRDGANNAVFSLWRENGTVVDSRATSEGTAPLGGEVTAPVTAKGNKLYVPLAGDQPDTYTEVVSLYQNNLSTDWRYDTGYGIESAPAVTEERVIIQNEDSSSNELTVLFRNGSVNWTADVGTGQHIGNAPTVHNGTIYAVSDDGNISAFDLINGNRKWGPKTPGSKVWGSPAYSNGYLFLADDTGYMYKIDASTGTVSKSNSVSSNGLYMSPSVANGVVYVGDAGGVFYALDSSDLTERWSYTTGNLMWKSGTTIRENEAYFVDTNSLHKIKGKSIDLDPPSVTEKNLVDRTDFNGILNDGEKISVYANITDESNISSATADLSELGAGSTLTLSNETSADFDWDGDGDLEGDIYGANATVDASSTTDGTSKSATITAEDKSTNSDTTNSFGSLTLDTVAPDFRNLNETYVNTNNPIFLSNFTEDTSGISASNSDVRITDSSGTLFNTFGNSDSVESLTGVSVNGKDEIIFDFESRADSLEQGAVDVNISAEDKAGNREDSKIKSLLVDTRAPFNISIDNPVSEVFRQSTDDFIVEYSYNESNPDYTEIKLFDQESNEDALLNLSEPGSDPDRTVEFDIDNSSQSLSSGETYDVKVFAEDLAGKTNSTTETSLLTVDDTSPVLNESVKISGTEFEFNVSDNEALNTSTIESTDFEFKTPGITGTFNPSSCPQESENCTVVVHMDSVVDRYSVKAGIAEGENVSDSAGNIQDDDNVTIDGIDGIPPHIRDTNLSDATDRDGVVAGGDKIKVYANVTDGVKVDEVTANLTEFGLGYVTLQSETSAGKKWANTQSTQYIAAGTGFTNNTAYRWTTNTNLKEPERKYEKHSDAVFDIAVDKDGYVYTGSLDHTAKKINPDGTENWTYTGHSLNVYGIDVDGNGNVYTSSEENLTKINPDGTENWTYTRKDLFLAIAVDKNGNVYTSSEENLTKINPDGTENWTYTGHTSDIYGIDVDENGYVYTGSLDHTAKKINPDGTENWTYTGFSSEVEDVAVDEGGNVYASSWGGKVKKINPDGTENWTYTGHTSEVRAVAVDKEGYVYTGSEDGTIKKLTPKGIEANTFNIKDGSAFSIAVSPPTETNTELDENIYGAEISVSESATEGTGKSAWINTTDNSSNTNTSSAFGSLTVDNTPPEINISDPTNSTPVYLQKDENLNVTFNYTENNPEYANITVGPVSNITKKVTVLSNNKYQSSWSEPHASAPNCGSISYEGSGTEINPYKVSNDYQLQCIKNSLSAHYKLTQNINASGTEQWNGGKGFRPIGHYYYKGGSEYGGQRFRGSLDGNNHSVKDLYINRGGNNTLGLIGSLEDGSIANIGVVDANITGDFDVGVIAGHIKGSSRIQKSYSSGKISATDFAGGIVGNQDNGIINNTYSLSKISTSSGFVGGITGYLSDGTVTNSFSTGNISSGGSSKTGGLIGYNGSGSVSDSYWDTESSGQSSSAGGTGLTSSEMQGSSAEMNMEGLDFSSIWVVTSVYPDLVWQQDNSGSGLPDGKNKYVQKVLDSGFLPGEGAYNITVKLNDSAGQTGKDVEINTVFIDSTPPSKVSDLTHEDETANEEYDDDQQVDFNWTDAVDDISGIDYYNVYNSSDGGTTYSGAHRVDSFSNYTVSAVDGDEVKINVESVDKAGNIGDNRTSNTITVDTQPPQVNIQDPLSKDDIVNDREKTSFKVNGTIENDLTGNITVNVSDGSSEVSEQDIEFTEGNFSVEIDISSLEDGSIDVEATATDKAGNTGDTATKLLTKDTVAPDFSHAYNISKTKVNATLNDSGVGLKPSSIEASDFGLDTGSISSIDASAVSSGEAKENVTITLSEGIDSDALTVSVEGRINDTGGNNLTSGTQTVTGMDSIPPEFSQKNLTDATNGDGQVSEGDKVTISANVTDGETVSTVTANLSELGAGSSVSMSSEVDAGYDWDEDSTLESDIYGTNATVGSNSGVSGSEANATVTAEDDSGNSNTSTEFGQLTLDDTPPEINIKDPLNSSPDYIQTDDPLDVKFNYTEQNPDTANITIGPTTKLTQSLSPESSSKDTSLKDPIEISTCNELQNIQNDLDANYTLTQNIDCSNTETWNYNGSIYKGFEPLGKSSSEDFSGILDGKGYAIQNLHINRPEESPVGLIRKSDYGTIQNLGITNANITGGNRLGGLVGAGQGDISNSYVTGSVEGKDYVGGLSGDSLGNIKKSYSTGNIKGERFVGGLAGENFANITKSYSTGNVEGEEYVGGLVGGASGNISESYSTGKVTGKDVVGGLAGATSGNIIYSYWDTESSGQTTSAGGTGLTTSEMTGTNARTNMTGFDFTDTWKTVEDNYPKLGPDSNSDNTNIVVEKTLKPDELPAEGMYDLNISLNDSTGLKGQDREINAVFVDSTAPENVSNLRHEDETAKDGYDDDEKIEFNWTAAKDDISGVDHYKVYYSKDGGASYAIENIGNNSNYTLDGVDSDEAKIKVQAIDRAGNTGDNKTSNTITVDTTPPEADIHDPLADDNIVNSAEDESLKVNGTISNDDSGEYDLEVNDSSSSVSKTDLSFSDGNYSTTIDVSTLNDGEITVQVAPTDDAGNTGDTATKSLTKDSTPPDFSNAYKVSKTVINATLEDSTTGLNQSSISVSDFSLNVGSISSIDVSSISSGDAIGNITIYLDDRVNSDQITVSIEDKIKDLANNNLTSGFQTVSGMDGIPPEISDFTGSGVEDADNSGQDLLIYFNSSQELSDINVSVEDSEGNLDYISETGFSESTITEGFNYSAVFDATESGVYNATLITAEDVNGLNGSSLEYNVTDLDNENPSVTDIEVIDRDEDGRIDASNVTFSKAIDDSTVVADDWNISSRNADSFDTGTQTDDDRIQVRLALDSNEISGTGVKEVTYTRDEPEDADIQDLSGNDLSDIDESFEEDDAARPLAKLSLSADPVYDGDLTQEVTLDYTEDMNQSIKPELVFSGTEGSWNEESSGWTDSDTFSASYSVDDQDEETEATVTISEGEDVGGNIQFENSTSFGVDTENPNASTELDGSQVFEGSSVNITKYFDYSTSDGESVVYSYDGNGAGFTTISSPESWDSTALDDGTYTFYLDVTDDAGNINTSFGEASVNNLPPSDVSVDSPSTRVYRNLSGILTVEYSYSEGSPNRTVIDLVDDSGVSDASIEVSEDSSNPDGSVVFDLGDKDYSLDEETYDIGVTAFDDASRSTYEVSSDKLTVDDTPPYLESPQVLSGTEMSFNVSDSISGLDASTVESTDFEIEEFSATDNSASFSIKDCSDSDSSCNVTVSLSSPTNFDTLTVDTGLGGSFSDTAENANVSAQLEFEGTDQVAPGVKSLELNVSQPLSEADIGKNIETLIEFNESMNTSKTPDVKLDGLDSEYTVTGIFENSTYWNGSFSFTSPNDQDADARLVVNSTEDSSGNNISLSDNTASVEVDTLAPIILEDGIRTQNLSGNADLTNYIEIVEDDGGSTSYEFNDSGSWAYISSPESWDTTEASDGVVDIRVNDSDDAGNYNVLETETTVDNTKPRIEVNETVVKGDGDTVLEDGEEFEIVVNGSDDTTGVEKVEVNVSEVTTLDGFTRIYDEDGDGNYTQNFTMNVSAWKQNYSPPIRVYDYAGNLKESGTTEINVTSDAIDITSAAIETSIEDDENGNGIADIGDTVKIEWNSSEDEVSNVEDVEINFSAIGGSLQSATASSNIYSVSYTLQEGTTDGSFRGQVKATDSLSRTDTENSSTQIQVDNNPPGTPSDTEVTAETNARINVAWDTPSGDSPSEVSKYIIYRKAGGGSYTNTENTSGNYILDESLVHGRRYYYKIQTVDDADNLGANTSEKSRIADSEPPEIRKLKIQDLNGSDSFSSYTGTLNISAYAQDSPIRVEKVTANLSDLGGSSEFELANRPGDLFWETVDIEELSEDTEYNITATAEDPAGHTNTTEETISLDSRRPSIEINSPEGEWYTQKPELDIDFRDDKDIGKVDYRLGSQENYTDLFDSVSGNYTAKWSLDLWSDASEGENFLYFNVTDGAGNYINTSNDSEAFNFRKDTVSPTTYDNYTGKWVNSNQTVNITETDATSGIENTTVCVGEGCTPTSEYTEIFNFSDNGIHYLSYNSSDIAGNNQNIQTTKIRIDKEEPEVSGESIEAVSSEEPLEEGGQFEVRINVSENISYIPENGVTVDLSDIGQGERNLTNASSGIYNATFTLNPGYDINEFKPEIQAEDAAGNTVLKTPETGIEIDSEEGSDDSGGGGSSGGGSGGGGGFGTVPEEPQEGDGSENNTDDPILEPSEPELDISVIPEVRSFTVEAGDQITFHPQVVASRASGVRIHLGIPYSKDHTETRTILGTSEFEIPIDTTGIPAGQYSETLRVTAGEKTETAQLNLEVQRKEKEAHIEVNSSKSKVEYTYRFEEAKSGQASLETILYNSTGHSIKKKTTSVSLSNQRTFEDIISLSNLESGDYRLETTLKTDSSIYSGVEEFTIEDGSLSLLPLTAVLTIIVIIASLFEIKSKSRSPSPETDHILGNQEKAIKVENVGQKKPLSRVEGPGNQDKARNEAYAERESEENRESSTEPIHEEPEGDLSDGDVLREVEEAHRLADTGDFPGSEKKLEEVEHSETLSGHKDFGDAVEKLKDIRDKFDTVFR